MMHKLPISQQPLLRRGVSSVLASVAALVVSAPAMAQTGASIQDVPTARAVVTVQAGQPGKKISSDLMGIFFEDINYAADGGLYAELIQNRSFEYSNQERREWNPLTAWELVQRGGGKGRVTMATVNALHTNNPNYAVLTVEEGGGDVGLVNSGFDGIALKAGERYNFSCFARRQAGENVPLVVTLESQTGTVYGTAMLKPLSKDWLQYAATIQATDSDNDARLMIGTKSVGAIALDMVSLFPAQTFRNHPNGLRADLAQVLADLKPRFVRFPGGCVAHGDTLGNIYSWKDTIGPVQRRKAQRNLWGYHQTTGLGYFEYFQFCEDIGAKPLPVVAAGVDCQFRGGQQCIPLANMDEYIQDVLDLVEWANGPATSYWGAKRAAAGHSQPFNLQYLAVGNEDAVTPEFKERFEMIEKAVKAKYPQVTVIGTSGPFAGGADFDEGWKFANQMNLPLVDEHYYMPPQWFLNNLNRYDSYDRARPKVYLGEYASQGNTLFNALAEAAYMTSLERNGDVVHLASYAPLLAKAGHTQWNPDLIYFNNTSIVPSVNYYVQQLYGQHSGDIYLPNTVAFTLPNPAPKPVSAFVGTWDTQAEFENVRLESGANSALNPTGTEWNWDKKTGTWKVENGLYSQSGGEQPALYKIAGAQVAGVAGNPSYTLSLRARKTGGREGFLIGFGATDAANYYWWNVGGWNNTQHGIEKQRSGASLPVGTLVPGHIETNRWYDIKIVVNSQPNGQQIQCFLDGKLIHDVVDDGKSPTDTLVASSVRDTKTGDIILKLVNVTPFAMQSQINLAGLGAVKPLATRIVLSGDPTGSNGFENPRSIMPQTGEIRVGKSFVYDAPPHSFTVIRMKTR